MKRIPFVPDIHMQDAGGDEYYRIPGTDRVCTIPVLLVPGLDGKPVEQKNAPWIERQYSFLLQRTADANCVKDIEDAIEAELFRVEVRTALKDQKDKAKARGYWELEDKHAQAILNATTKPATPINPPHTFNYVPFILAVKNQTTPAAEIELPPVSNGASAQAAS